MSAIIVVTHFIVSLFFSLLIFSLWVRLALGYLRVSVLHPISQLIYKITNPLITPIQGLLGKKHQPKQRYDIPTFIALVAVEFVKIICFSFLLLQGLIPVVWIFLYVIADLIIQPCDILFYAILIRVIMSFVNPGWNGPIADLLRLVTEPLLQLGRKIIPDISGFDFAPFIILALLKIITLFVSACLPWRLL